MAKEMNRGSKKKLIDGVEEVGKRVKKWRGHYEVTIDNKRRHKAVTLGLVADMTKTEAKDKLRDIKVQVRVRAARFQVSQSSAALHGGIVNRETGDWTPPDQITFEWFWEHRYKPAKAEVWGRATEKSITSIFKNHILPALGARTLTSLTKHDMQLHLNSVAVNGGRPDKEGKRTRASKTLIRVVRTYVKGLLEEAVEQEIIPKNPARKLQIPWAKRVCEDVATIDQLKNLWSRLEWRDRLIMRIFALCAFRRGEVEALRVRCFKEDHFQVSETYSRIEHRVKEAKTDASVASVTIPPELRKDIKLWIEMMGPEKGRPDCFLFAARNGNPMNLPNLLKRRLKKIGRKVGIENVTFQMMRRSCATLLQEVEGYSPKDAQGHLRHADSSMTMNVYTKVLKGSVVDAVEKLEKLI